MATIFKTDYSKLKNLSANELEFIDTLMLEIAMDRVPLDMLKTQYDYSKLFYRSIAANIYTKLTDVVRKVVTND